MIPSKTTYVPTIVIGGGQAGLATGYYLSKQKLPYLILDAHPRIGDAWRNRWDSLRLFTPARNCELPGMALAMSSAQMPNKDQVADYLQDYALRFRLPVRNNVRVDRLWREDGRFFLQTSNETFEADNVIVAMANYQSPKRPSFAPSLDPSITQLHSHEYRNPSQLQPGDTLVVGMGNSGADIAMELAKTHHTWLAGKESGHIPFPIDSFFARHFAFRLVRFIGHHVLTVKTPIGKKARPALLHQATALIRVKPHQLLAAGVERVPRVANVRDGLPMLADGRTLDVKNVIWCTGYHHGFPWIDLRIFDEHGQPKHQEGVVREIPGLYFVGLHFLYAMSSATLVGVSRDAHRIVKAVATRASQRRSTVASLLPVQVAKAS